MHSFLLELTLDHTAFILRSGHTNGNLTLSVYQNIIKNVTMRLGAYSIIWYLFCINKTTTCGFKVNTIFQPALNCTGQQRLFRQAFGASAVWKKQSLQTVEAFCSVWSESALFAYVPQKRGQTYNTHVNIHVEMGLFARKPVFGGSRTTKVQISLRIRTDWSAPLSFAYW